MECNRLAKRRVLLSSDSGKFFGYEETCVAEVAEINYY